MSRLAESRSDTIVAVATALGEAAVAVVRLSGPEALTIAGRLLAEGSVLPPSHRAAVRRLWHGGRPIDEVLVICFHAPRSFTGEDVVELQCHGGLMTVRLLVDGCRASGARVAEPGELTRRAMLNGKLDLLQVEAIADVIAARSEAGHSLAQAHLAGRLSEAVGRLSEGVASLLMLVEAGIDFGLEEHVFSVPPAEVVARCHALAIALERLLSTHDAGRMRMEGIRIALVGRPNAGKSSLLNHLLGVERAMVSEVAGTTRDTIEETVVHRGLLFRFVDTAGLHESEDRLEAMGMARSRAALTGADAALVVAAEGGDLAALAEELAAAGRPFGVLWNKRDLGGADPRGGAGVVAEDWVSLLTGEGLEGLWALLEGLAAAAGVRFDEDTGLITRARHLEALGEALASVQRAMGAAEMGLDAELVAMDLREALDGLGKMTGAVTSDEILNRIFAGFCIGK